MLTFYGSPMSSAGRTRWMLEEVGVPYEYVVVSVRGGASRTPEFLALNPSGKIPFVVDGNVKLAESMAINLYLAERYAPGMYPADIGQRALVHQWSFWAISNLQPELLTILHHTAILPEADRSQKAIDGAKANVGPYLDLLEKSLAGRDHLVADRFTVADVNVASVVNLARMFAIDMSKQPSVGRWLEALRARPAYAKAASG